MAPKFRHKSYGAQGEEQYIKNGRGCIWRKRLAICEQLFSAEDDEKNGVGACVRTGTFAGEWVRRLLSECREALDSRLARPRNYESSITACHTIRYIDRLPSREDLNSCGGLLLWNTFGGIWDDTLNGFLIPILDFMSHDSMPTALVNKHGKE